MSNELTPEDKERIAEIEKIIAPLKHFELNEATGHMWSFLCRPDVSQAIVKMFGGEKKPLCEQPDNECNANTLPDFGKHLSQTTPKEVEQKEWWLPEIGQEYFYINVNQLRSPEVAKNKWRNDTMDSAIRKHWGVFPTEEAATKAAEAIRETLKQL